MLQRVKQRNNLFGHVHNGMKEERKFKALMLGIIEVPARKEDRTKEL